MAFEYRLDRDGSYHLSTAADARKSAVSGSTQAGPNGSGQFLAVYLSSANEVNICGTGFQALSTVASSLFLGFLQNTPGPGEACDVGYFGTTKMVAAAAISIGAVLQTSSTAAGAVTTFTSGNGRAIGFAREAASAAGAVFSGFVGGPMFGAST